MVSSSTPMTAESASRSSLAVRPGPLRRPLRRSYAPPSALLPVVMVGALLLLLALALIGPAAALADEPADDAITTDTYDVEETFEIRVDDVGNVKYRDVLLYDREFFDAHAADFEEYPFLLSRRYRTMEDVNEIQDFQTGMNKEAGSITLSFGEKGRAYNMEDHWIMYGFYTEPVQISGSDVTIEETSTVNSDYTLWQDLEFRTTTHVSLPAGATNVRWDEGEYALVWEMPEQLAALTAGGGNVLQENRVVFVTLFAILFAGAGGVGLVVLLRSRRGPAAAATAGSTATAGTTAPGSSSTATASREQAAPTIAESAADAPAAPPSADAATAMERADGEASDAPRARFCRHCGARFVEGTDERFCTHCGKEIH